jgi:hypothetical protein
VTGFALLAKSVHGQQVRDKKSGTGLIWLNGATLLNKDSVITKFASPVQIKIWQKPTFGHL